MHELLFEDRHEAGRALAQRLTQYAGHDNVVVLGLARGGVPVAYEVAHDLGLPMEPMIVRKLGVPGQEELAMGAIASGGVRVINDDLVRSLGISEREIERAIDREQRELERREQQYLGRHTPINLRGRRVIITDDGLATGASMRTAVIAARQRGARNTTVAVPVAPAETVEQLKGEADQVIAVATPEPFGGVGRWYRNFDQTTDEQVQQLLERAGYAPQRE